MAPLCADPRQIVIALDAQRRSELLTLLDDIISSMAAALESKPDEPDSLPVEDDKKSVDDNGDENSDVRRRLASEVESVTLFDADDEVEEAETAENDDEARCANAAAAPENKKTESTSKKNPFRNVSIGVPWKKKSTADAPQGTQNNNNNNNNRDVVKSAAREYMQAWTREFMPRLKEMLGVEDTDEILAEREARRRRQGPVETTAAGSSSSSSSKKHAAVHMQMTLYPPVPTPLATSLDNERDGREIVSCVLLLLLSTGKYSAHSRVLMLRLASSLHVAHRFLNHEEVEISQSLLEQSTAAGKDEAMTAEAEAARRREENKLARFWKVGLAGVAGATIIGVTGGLAAPLVAGAVGSILGGVGLGGVASFLGVFWMNGALVGALFGAYGAKMTGSMMDKYAKEVQDFKFIPLGQTTETNKTNITQGDNTSQKDNTSQEEDVTPQTATTKDRRLRVTICINGWLNSPADITRPWLSLASSSSSEIFALRYELTTLLALGTALTDLVHSLAWKALTREVIKRTALAALATALWPAQLLGLAATNLDNPFHRAANRSQKAGRLLADALAHRVQGQRPVTLVGFSLGASAVHECLRTLAERRAFGLVEAVVMIGAPAPADSPHWNMLKTVVSGPVYNVFSENDLVLGYLYRAHSLRSSSSRGVAGLRPITGVDGVQNIDLSARVGGHLRYPRLIGAILRRCGFDDDGEGDKENEDDDEGKEIEKDDVIRLKEEYAAGCANDDGTVIDQEREENGKDQAS